MPEEFTVGIANTILVSGETLSLHRLTASTGDTLKVWAGGVSQDGSTTSGLTSELYDITSAVTRYSTSESYESGNPIVSASVDGDDLEAKIVNNSDIVSSASGFLTFSLG